MRVQDMLSFRKNLADRGIILCYNGYMTEEVLFSIGATIKQKIAVEETSKRVARGLFSVFVEQVQNVIRYSEEKETTNTGNADSPLRYGMLIVGKEREHHFVACGNMIDKKDGERLRATLRHIQSLNADGLKALFRETLKGETPAGSQGAGVGFIDIARRATHGFEFDITRMDETFSYFALKAYI